MGFPEQMIQWCETKIAGFESSEWQCVQEEYNKEIVKVGSGQANTDDVEKSGNQFDMLLQKLSSACASRKKSTGEEIRKFCG